jgi:hypothetical protein
MSQITEWAEAIATVVAPDEVELASPTVEAYIEGGAARADLYRAARADAGVSGFGVGESAFVLPAIYQALVSSADVVLPFLMGALPTASAAVGFVSGAINVRDRYVKYREKRQLEDVVEDDPKLDVVCAAVSRALVAQGVPASDGEAIAHGVVQTLLLDAKSSASFIEQLRSAST